MTWLQTLKRARWQRQVQGSALADCWGQSMPKGREPWHRARWLAVDAEMSALEPDRGELLSLGWVAIENGAINLQSAAHHLLQPQHSVGQSAAIHQLRDCEFTAAEPAAAVLTQLLHAAAGHILVFHNADLDLAFLNRACQLNFGAPLLMPYADTLLLELSLKRRRDQVIQQGDLRLQRCREQYDLPSAPAHNALVDALATAELFLAHICHRSRGQPLTINQLL